MSETCHGKQFSTFNPRFLERSYGRPERATFPTLMFLRRYDGVVEVSPFARK